MLLIFAYVGKLNNRRLQRNNKMILMQINSNEPITAKNISNTYLLLLVNSLNK